MPTQNSWTAAFVQQAKAALTPKPLTYDDIDEGDQISYVLQGKLITGLIKCKMDVYWAASLLLRKFIILTQTEDGSQISGTHFLISAEDLNRFSGKIIAKAENKVAQVKECSCDIMVLMASGCQCSAFVAQKTGLASQFQQP